MQSAWLDNPARPCADSDGVTSRIRDAADHVRRQGGRIIFVQHADQDAPAGSGAWQIVPGLPLKTGDIKLDKTSCDAFAATSLAEQLAGTRTLYVSGFATEFCVDTTIRAAASRGFQVVALADAHTTSDRPHLDAKAIIAHHNWIWAGMAVPAGSGISVRTAAEAF